MVQRNLAVHSSRHKRKLREGDRARIQKSGLARAKTLRLIADHITERFSSVNQKSTGERLIRDLESYWSSAKSFKSKDDRKFFIQRVGNCLKSGDDKLRRQLEQYL